MPRKRFGANSTQGLSFDMWMRRVNAHLETGYHLTSEDLPDCTYRDWYDQGVTPIQAARRAIKNAKES